MKAVVLAAGEGRRMRPLTSTLPKAMLPLSNQPILAHILRQLISAGISECVFVTGYKSEAIESYFGDGSRWKISIKYKRQSEQLGTGHAVHTIRNLVDEPFLLLNGDVIIRAPDIAHLMVKRTTCISLFQVDNPHGLGIVEVAGDLVVRIHEKTSNPPGTLANAGAYLLTDAIFPALERITRSPRGEYELTDAIQLQVDDGKEVSFVRLDSWNNISYPWDLLSANEVMMLEAQSGNSGKIESGAWITQPVDIGTDTIIRSGSYITGPVVIGRNCDIGPNCYIRPYTAIGSYCHIGASVEIKNSIIMDSSRIPHLSYIGDSIIGPECNLGAGTTVANLRLDKRNISCSSTDTSRRKFGAVLGAGVETGINVSISPGTIIGNNSRIWPDTLVGGEIPPFTTVLERRDRWERSNRQ
jgi:bifunctional UDP-N-acetylglucosamine pyrophosphorylase/glucosamine-1-phosphate N-acetyltransferase